MTLFAMPTDLKSYLALWLTAGIGPKIFANIFSSITNLSEIFENPERCKAKLKLDDHIIASLSNPNWDLVEQHLNWQTKSPSHHIITLQDATYPKALLEISDPPPVLLAIGDITLLHDPLIAIVGSRRMSPYGKANAYLFAKDLAQSGLTIVSGLATGIDTAAHNGALAAKNGKTIAILGTGIDIIYPRENQQLAHKICNAGLLISEFALGTQPAKYNFPQRNRLISGISLGILIVEAAIASGSLITARFGLEHGREVFAIPGSIHSPLSKGCHQLIRTGAKLVESSLDILLELKPQLENSMLNKNTMAQLPNENTTDNDSQLDSEYATLLAHIDFDTTPTDVIIARSQLKTQVVSSMLLMLELEGYIAGVPGGYIRLRG